MKARIALLWCIYVLWLALKLWGALLDKLWEGEGRGVAFVVLSDRSSQKDGDMKAMYADRLANDEATG